MDLTTYQNNRRDAFKNVFEPKRFKWELQAYVENETEMDALRLKTALEVLTHLATPEDFNLIKKTLYAFDSNTSGTGKAKRSIGNLVMKAIYSNNQADVAIEVKFTNQLCKNCFSSIFINFQFYNDPKLNEFFGGFKCTFICLDLLYINGKYSEILKIDSEKRQHLWPISTNFTKFIDVLVFGACYKLVSLINNIPKMELYLKIFIQNTVESLDYAQKLWSTVGQSSQFKRCIAFTAALALNQQKPSLAVQVLKDADFSNLTEQIKLLALADLGYENEILKALSIWMNDGKFCKKHISIDVVS